MPVERESCFLIQETPPKSGTRSFEPIKQLQ